MKTDSLVDISTETTILDEVKQFDYESHKMDIREIILELSRDLKDTTDKERKEKIFMHIKCLLTHLSNVESFQFKLLKASPVLS